MARTALYAPAHRVAAKTPLGSGGAPADIAPSVDWGGSGIQDPRLPYNIAKSPTGAGVLGWYGSNIPKVVSQVPSAISTVNIAVAAHATSGTALPLVTTTGAGITVVPVGGVTVFPNYGVLVPAGACAIDGLPSLTRFGGVTGASGGHFVTSYYNPATMIARAISITGISGGAGGTFVVKGADVYGYPMTQNIVVAAGVNTVNSTKAFKFIYSVTPSFTDGTGTYSVGTADIYGFPLAADYFSDADCYWGNVIQAVSTFTAAVSTTASATTGDVRGTFTPASSSNGTLRLDMFITPSLARVATVPQSVGLCGVTQF